MGHAAETDNDIMVRRTLRESSLHAAKMDKFFRKADREQDGYIDRREFRSALTRGEMKAWLESMDIDVGDTKQEQQQFWAMICSDKPTLASVARHEKEARRGSTALSASSSFLKTPAEAKEEKLTVEMFTERVAKIRGRARTMDLIALQHSVGQIQQQLF